MALVPAAAALLLAVGADSGRGTVEPEGGLQIAADAGNAILTWFGEPGYMWQDPTWVAGVPPVRR